MRHGRALLMLGSLVPAFLGVLTPAASTSPRIMDGSGHVLEARAYSK